MKSYNLLCALFGVSLIFFYSLCMEQPENDNKQLISLITIIKTQQTVLGYTPSTENLCDPYYFESAFERLAILDPKDDQAKAYQKAVKNEAIPCINTIIYQNPYFEDLIPLITKRFHNHSLSFLIETIKQNEKQLKKQQLFDYYQSITQKESTPTPSSIPQRDSKTSTRKQPQEIIEELPQIKPLKKAVKDNEILFTQSTYKDLTYNYQAYLYWDKKDLKCNIYDPFINVAITAFNEDGSVAFNNPKIPLPLPVLINDKGNIKSEIFLPLSQRPFTVNYKNTEPLQKTLPRISLNFYKNVGEINNEDDIEYLEKNHVIQKQGNSYIHGQNSCKPLLEGYFRLWGIPEDEYKQVQEPEEKQQEGWIPAIWKTTQRVFGTVKRFVENIYYSLLAIKTAIFGE